MDLLLKVVTSEPRRPCWMDSSMLGGIEAAWNHFLAVVHELWSYILELCSIYSVVLLVRRGYIIFGPDLRVFDDSRSLCYTMMVCRWWLVVEDERLPWAAWACWWALTILQSSWECSDAISPKKLQNHYEEFDLKQLLILLHEAQYWRRGEEDVNWMFNLQLVWYSHNMSFQIQMGHSYPHHEIW